MVIKVKAIFLKTSNFIIIGYYNKPTWTKYDFKVLVEPGSEECFYQKVGNGSVFHVSFQVTKIIYFKIFYNVIV
jgi:hypothetical protein